MKRKLLKRNEMLYLVLSQPRHQPPDLSDRKGGFVHGRLHVSRRCCCAESIKQWNVGTWSIRQVSKTVNSSAGGFCPHHAAKRGSMFVLLREGAHVTHKRPRNQSPNAVGLDGLTRPATV